jgi:hypothetical protein
MKRKGAGGRVQGSGFRIGIVLVVVLVLDLEDHGDP